MRLTHRVTLDHSGKKVRCAVAGKVVVGATQVQALHCSHHTPSSYHGGRVGNELHICSRKGQSCEQRSLRPGIQLLPPALGIASGSPLILPKPSATPAPLVTPRWRQIHTVLQPQDHSMREAHEGQARALMLSAMPCLRTLKRLGSKTSAGHAHKALGSTPCTSSKHQGRRISQGHFAPPRS